MCVVSRAPNCAALGFALWGPRMQHVGYSLVGARESRSARGEITLENAISGANEREQIPSENGYSSAPSFPCNRACCRGFHA